MKGLFVFFTSIQGVNSQITLKQDYTHNDPADIGTFQGINFKEGGFSALYPIVFMISLIINPAFSFTKERPV